MYDVESAYVASQTDPTLECVANGTGCYGSRARVIYIFSCPCCDFPTGEPASITWLCQDACCFQEHYACACYRVFPFLFLPGVLFSF